MIPTKRLPTVMQQGYSFARVPSVEAERSVFDRSHGYKTMFDSGLLIPVFYDYAIPGDTMAVRMTALARLTTPIKPFMDNMYLESFFFAVPFRLIWANAVKFFGEQVNPGDSIAFTVPIMTSPAAGYVLGSLGDYFGLPTVGVPAVTAAYNHSALFSRAFFKIYNDWFRDENLISARNGEGGVGVVQTDDGPDTNTDMNAIPPKRGKRFDYFTSCLTSPQKGAITAAAVTPLVAAGVGVGTTPTFWSIVDSASLGSLARVAGGANSATRDNGAGGTAGAALAWNNPGLQVLISDLRLSIATQQFLERDARGGTRYPELIWSHFRVRSSDARLQRSEYLGGGSSPVVSAPVAQTSQAAAPTFKDGLANLGAVAAAVVGGHGFQKSFEEHCVVIGIVNVRADITYSQGKERMWDYSTRYDFPWPVFAHLGEQAVLNKEIYCTGAAADANVFGYQERYAERRYKPSRVTNLFRPTAAGTLELWHLSEKFAALPTLGQTFIEDQLETILDTRVAVPSEPDWYFDSWFDYKYATELPVFSVPGLTRL